MRSGHNTKEEWGAKPTRRIPTLVDLCVQKAVDNIRYLGDVGETDQNLLERILPHCNVDQLMHIEDSTKEQDLSPITDKLWKNFYVKEYNAENTRVVVDRMKQKRVSFSWRQLYEAKQKDVEEKEQKSFERIKQLYKKQDAKKQSRQVQPCTKVPPSNNKRSWFGGGINIGNNKSGIMKKAKLEFINSREVKNLSAMKRTTMSTNHVPSNHRVVPVQKLSQYPKDSAGSSSKFNAPKFNAPPRRRF